MKLFRFAAITAALACASVANAFVFVGSYEVNDGPHWTTNPMVYSAQEAAALLFGGSPSDYAISIRSDLITFTGWYDGWGEHTGMEFAHDYKLDLGAPGYDDPGGMGTARSAWVADGLSNAFVNYVWRVEDIDAVPDVGSTLSLLGLSILAMACYRRRRS